MDRTESFQRAVAALTSPTFVIITQVDPDAIGAAAAMAWIIGHLRPELEVRMCASGAVGHPQNRALINRCGLASELLPIDVLGEYDGAGQVLVDSSTSADNRLPAGMTLSPTIVIDHHRGSDLHGSPERFIWIEDLGATCTMVTELAEALGLALPASRHLPLLLAMGIYTDTRSLISADTRDRRAYGRLIEQLDISEFQSLLSYPLPESHYDNLLHALTHTEQRGGRLLASVGHIRPEEGDDLSTFADYLLRRDGVTLVVVWGIMDSTVRISARNANLSDPLDDFLRARFGAASGAKLAPDGRGEGGARLRLDLGLWLSDATRPQIEAMVSTRLKELIFSD
jgi:nanoRNase/pAp phosphatase (c-di-AMP/oligoRNAs hydrolase)